MAGAGMQIAGNIFNEMVMEEAIKDKTRQVQKEMEEAEAGQLPQYDLSNQDKLKDDDSDSDFNSDGDDAILQGLRAQRMKEMKQQQKEEIENAMKGHGTY